MTELADFELAHVPSGTTEWWRAYYHFMRPHQTLGETLPGYKRKKRSKTPAMALGLTDEVWTVGQILRMPLPPMAAAA